MAEWYPTSNLLRTHLGSDTLLYGENPPKRFPPAVAGSHRRDGRVIVASGRLFPRPPWPFGPRSEARAVLPRVSPKSPPRRSRGLRLSAFCRIYSAIYLYYATCSTNKRLLPPTIVQAMGSSGPSPRRTTDHEAGFTLNSVIFSLNLRFFQDFRVSAVQVWVFLSAKSSALAAKFAGGR